LHSGQQRRGRDKSEFYTSPITCFKEKKKKREQFQSATLEDEELRLVREAVQSGWPKLKKPSTKIYRPLFSW